MPGNPCIYILKRLGHQKNISYINIKGIKWYQIEQVSVSVSSTLAQTTGHGRVHENIS